jgi:hypothetical protein
MGTTHFLTTSGGVHIANPKFLATSARELAEAQRHLATFPERTRRRTKATAPLPGRSPSCMPRSGGSDSTSITRPPARWSATTTSSRTSD